MKLLLHAVTIAVALAAYSAEAGESRAWRMVDAAHTLVSDVVDQSQARDWLRERLWREDDAGRYGLHLDDNWQDVAAKRADSTLVVFIHGFNSSPAKNAAILAPLRAAGFPVAAFAYPNDWRITDSAAFLSAQLKALAAAHPNATLALVTHSMGGLVARACVEDAELDPGNVARLVMIAPPTHGSLIAHASFGADVWEHWIARRDGSVWRRWRDSVVDGLGEASDDLVPGSPFLTQLNTRPRNPRIQYAILLGTHSPVSPREYRALRWVVRSTGRMEGLARYADSFDAMLTEMDELVDGKGDGVVAIERGRLDGVDDVVLLPFSHLSYTGDSVDEEAVRQVHAEVLARLH